MTERMGLLATVFILVMPLLVHSEHARQPVPPQNAPIAVDVQEALRLGEACVKERKLETAGNHIESVVFQSRADKPFWEITWRTDLSLTRPVKGGYFMVRITLDRSCSFLLGE